MVVILIRRPRRPRTQADGPGAVPVGPAQRPAHRAMTSTAVGVIPSIPSSAHRRCCRRPADRIRLRKRKITLRWRLPEPVTYHNAENGFCVLRAKARGHRDVVTVVGHAAAIAGAWVTAWGKWVNDRAHGQQFKASFLRTSPDISGRHREIPRVRHDPRRWPSVRQEARARLR